MLDSAQWVGKGGVRTPVTDMSTKWLVDCLRLIEETDYGADCREAIELELEIRRLGLRGPFFTNTSGPPED